MAKKIRRSKGPRRQFSGRPARATPTRADEGQLPRQFVVVSGFLARTGKRTLLSIGGLSVEVLTTDGVPQSNADLEQARKKTETDLGEVTGQNVQLRGYQSDGYLLSAKPAPKLGSVPVKAKERTRFQKVEQVLADNRQTILTIPGVIGVRPGYRFKDGWITDEPCIVAIVNQKLAARDVPLALRIPEKIEDVDIDVAIATPVQQYVAQAARQGRSVPVDPVNPEGFAVPSGSTTVQAFTAEAITAQLVRDSKYVQPDGIQLEPVHGPFKVKCHVSPDAGWPTLSTFLDGTKSRLTIAMYDFTAPHIMRAIESTAMANNATVSLILDPGLTLSHGGEPNNPKSGDFTEDAVRADMQKKLKSNFKFVWAAVTHKGKVDNGIFPTAYHIKVAVRDGEAFWLSSGNWQSSNQPNIDPLGPDRGLPDVQPTYNREWHVIVNEKAAADTYERFVKYDEEQAAPLNVSPQIAMMPDLFVPEELVAQAAAAQYFAPSDITVSASDTVQPLLTPDNYSDHILSLIAQAKHTLFFQNQYIKINVDASKNPPKFAALVDALRGKIDDGIDVRIILRDIV